MIYSLTGEISRIDDNTIVVNTGSVAFEVICSYFTVSELASKSEKQTILTYLQVREDAMTLFGFKDKREKLIFNDLNLVSGVGPKMAISILSGLPLETLISSILNSDVKTLSSIKGLGKKTAERIVLELSSKFGGENGLENLINNPDLKVSSNSSTLQREIIEASDVLSSTGIPKSQAIELAKQNYIEGMTSEQLVVTCFKNLK